jgi:hypothetical protein
LFLNDIANGIYDLGNFGELQETINYFSTAAHDSLGDTAISFNVQSAATGDTLTIETLLDPNFADPNICLVGETPLACELRLSRPMVLIISFGPNSASQVSTYRFAFYLGQAVITTISNGTIPVLVTLPDDGTFDAVTLAAYNQIIVETAEANNLPLWNLYLTMQNATNGIYAIGGTGATDFTDIGLTGGVNRRNLAALQLLNVLRTDVLQ